MRRSVLLSIIDQAMISAFSLLLNLAFIALATPAEFGRFVLILAGAFFAQSAQNALVVMPLNYLLPGREDAEARTQLSMLSSANVVLTVLVVFVALGLALWFEIGILSAVAVVFYIMTNMLRDYARNVTIVQGRIGQALVLDAMAIAASVVLVALLWRVLPPEAAALLGMAGGNLLALLLARTPLALDLARLPTHARAYREVWRETRWALQGALQNEVEARSYVLIVERWRDVAALGTLQAGRVATSPLLLIASAWRRVARPRLVEDIHHGRSGGATRLLWSGVGVIGGATLLYGTALLAAWPLLDTHVFGARYDNMAAIVFCWWLYSGVVGLAGVPATLLEARRQFRELAAIGLGVAGLIVALLLALALTPLDISAVILILVGVHVLELVACCVLARGRPARLNTTPLVSTP